MNSVMNWLRIRTLMVVLLPGFVVLSGCGGLPVGQYPTAGQYPTTDGFHHSLPPTNTRIVIWGKQLFEEQRIRLTYTADDEGPILRVGKLLGAGMVVFTDVSITSGVVSDYSVSAYGGGGGSTTVSSASVSIRGVDVETSEVVWNGTARYPQQSESSPEENSRN